MKTNIGWQDKANPHKIALLDRYLSGKQGLQVLDLAAGYGWYSRHLRDRGHTVTALDIDVHFEEPGIKTLTVDLERVIDLPGASFDVIVAWDIIEHITNEALILCEIARLAKPGAQIFVSVPHGDDSRIAPSYLTYCHFKDKTHRREYTPAELTSKCTSVGLRALEVKLTGGDRYPYIVLNFIDNLFFRLCMRVLLRTFIMLGIIKSGTCHGDVFAVFEREKH